MTQIKLLGTKINAFIEIESGMTKINDEVLMSGQALTDMDSRYRETDT